MTNTSPWFSSVWSTTAARLTTSAGLGCLAFVVSFSLEPDLRVLIAYDLAISTYLGFLATLMANADGAKTREIAERREISHAAVLTMAAILSGLSLTGVGLMLHRSKSWSPLMANTHMALSLLAVFLSWTLLHVVFGFHYARLYYDPTPPVGEPANHPPLEFPDDARHPDFWDFMYFAFTLAVCYQVSDVSIRSRHLRRVALAHMLLSFLNVTFILGLIVEIVSTLANSGGHAS